MITIDEAAHYLLLHNLLSAESILHGDLVVASAASRNRSLRITRQDGNSYLLKQPEPGDPGTVYSLRCEASFYSFCFSHESFRDVLDFLPRLVFWDRDAGIFLLELLRDAKSLWEYYRNFEPLQFPALDLEVIGRALGTVHRVFGDRGLWGDAKMPWLRETVPWILQIHKPSPEMLESISPANYHTLTILQSQAKLGKSFDALREIWRPVTVIHNDIKSDNMLILSSGTNSGRTVGVKLVDWELVQVGDPAWDVAGLLQDFILFWVFSMEGPASASLDELAESARYPLQALNAAIRMFWFGYRNASGILAAEADMLLERAIQFSAARLIQSAYEIAQNERVMPAQSVLLLQVASNILDDPGMSQVQLYGLFQEMVA